MTTLIINIKQLTTPEIDILRAMAGCNDPISGERQPLSISHKPKNKLAWEVYISRSTMSSLIDRGLAVYRNLDGDDDYKFLEITQLGLDVIGMGGIVDRPYTMEKLEFLARIAEQIARNNPQVMPMYDQPQLAPDEDAIETEAVKDLLVEDAMTAIEAQHQQQITVIEYYALKPDFRPQVTRGLHEVLSIRLHDFFAPPLFPYERFILRLKDIGFEVVAEAYDILDVVSQPDFLPQKWVVFAVYGNQESERKIFHSYADDADEATEIGQRLAILNAWKGDFLTWECLPPSLSLNDKAQPLAIEQPDMAVTQQVIAAPDESRPLKSRTPHDMAMGVWHSMQAQWDLLVPNGQLIAYCKSHDLDYRETRAMLIYEVSKSNPQGYTRKEHNLTEHECLGYIRAIEAFVSQNVPTSGQE